MTIGEWITIGSTVMAVLLGAVHIGGRLSTIETKLDILYQDFANRVLKPR